MSDSAIQISFGIGTLADGKPAVVVNDQAIALAQIAARGVLPKGMEPPREMRDLMPPGEEYHGIQPGEKVLCEVEKLGRLENLILEQTGRQPHET